MIRTALLATLAAVLIIAAVIYLAAVRRVRTSSTIGARPATLETISIIEQPFVIFRALGPKEAHGRVAMVPVDRPQGTRYVAPLSCARVHFGGGTGVCLVEETAGTTITHVAVIFDRAFQHRHRVALEGLPIRARVSRDGRCVAITIYGEEHLPDGTERLATRTVLIDAASGEVVATLDQFALDTAGHRLKQPRDFASVAFAPDGDRFFATLTTESERYLVAGSVVERTISIVSSGFANEALSPDGHRLVIKRRIGDRGYWQLSVLDLASNREQTLKQGSRSVDDQVEWLDNDHVMYHDATADGTGVWALAIDGIRPPRLLVADAYSPSVER